MDRVASVVCRQSGLHCRDQAQIEERGNAFVQEVISRLRERSNPCGRLLERTFTSATFQQCPSPQEWIGALRWTVRGVRAFREGGNRRAEDQQFTWVFCADCRAAFSIAMTKHDELQQKGKSILCKRCLKRQLTQASVARAQHRLDFPEVSCEHCRRVFSLPRNKLEALRHRGKPILCPICLPCQLQKWRKEKSEYSLSHPLVACLACARRFRLSKETVDQLIANGRAAFCPTCLCEAREMKLDWRNEPLAKTAFHDPNMWTL